MSGIFKPVNPKYYDLNNSLSTGLIFDAQFWTGAGTTEADLTGGDVGTFLGATKPAWGQGTYGFELTFNGSTSYIEYPETAALDITSGNISIEALVYPTTLSVNQQIISKPKASGAHSAPYFMYCLQDDGSGHASLWLTTTGNINGIRCTGASMTLNAYNHIVGTYANGTGAIVYLNSVASATDGSFTGTISTVATPLRVGTQGGLGEIWNGRIVYIRIWTRTLSGPEVLALYQNPWRIYTQAETFAQYRGVSTGTGMGRNDSAT